MLRRILAVIAGYVAMFVIVVAALTAAYFALGTDASFKEGSFEPSVAWLVVMMVVGLGAAVVGGLVCRAVGKTDGAVTALILVVLILGLAQAIATAAAPAPPPEDLVRTGELSNLEAMQKARTPLWVAIANPIIGAVGVYVGGMLLRTGKRATSPNPTQ